MMSSMRTRPRNSLFLILGIVVLLVVASAIFISARGMSTQSIASGIVKDCSKVPGDHAPCYEAKVPDLYPKLSVPEIFDVIRNIRTLDTSYQFCHVLGHKVGERVVAEDPNDWVDAIPLNPPDGLCSNGFIHGVVGGRFRSEVLNDATIQQFLPDFIRACVPHDSWTPSDLDRAICYHGMGHLFDFITNANIPKALDLCSKVAPEDYSRVCIQGVFMQIYQPLEPDDYALIAQMPVKPTKTTVRQFCATFKNPIYVGSCLEESWPFFQKEITDGTGVKGFCSGQPDAIETDQCYLSMSSIVGRMSLGAPDKAASACNAFPASRQVVCYTSVSRAVIEEDRNGGAGAIALCEKADSDTASSCLDSLASTASFTFGLGTPELSRFCGLLPEPYRDRCGEAQY